MFQGMTSPIAQKPNLPPQRKSEDEHDEKNVATMTSITNAISKARPEMKQSTTGSNDAVDAETQAKRRLPDPKINLPKIPTSENSSQDIAQLAKMYYQKKSTYQELHLAPSLRSRHAFTRITEPSTALTDDMSTSQPPPEASQAAQESSKETIMKAFKESGYNELSESTRFDAKDSPLKAAGEVEEIARSHEESGASEDTLGVFVDSKGNQVKSAIDPLLCHRKIREAYENSKNGNEMKGAAVQARILELTR